MSVRRLSLRPPQPTAPSPALLPAAVSTTPIESRAPANVTLSSKPGAHEVEKARPHGDEDATAARWLGPAGRVAGLIALAAAPLTGGLSLVAAAGFPILAREASRVLTRDAAKSSYFDHQLEQLQKQLTAPDTVATLLKMKLVPEEEGMLKAVLKATGTDDPAVHLAVLKAMFNGAHLVIKDQGGLYRQDSAAPGARTRPSSHQSIAPQYEIDGKVTGPVLFGETTDGTWLQFEKDSGKLGISSVWNLPFHLEDYVEYRLTHLNQSRYGDSKFTEKQPLVLDPTHPLTLDQL